MNLSYVHKCKNCCFSSGLCGNLDRLVHIKASNVDCFADDTAVKEMFQNPCDLPPIEKQIYFATCAVHLRGKQK